MNREYAKFDEPQEEFIPAITEDPYYFSGYQDVLIPREYTETYKGVTDQGELIKTEAERPPTPPELEPGRVGCKCLHDEADHYVAPCYDDPEYQRQFITKLILANMCNYIPSFLVLVVICFWRKIDHEVLESPGALWANFGVTVVGFALYCYFVGLCRNPPYVYIAVAVKVILNTMSYGGGMLLMHNLCLIFIFQYNPHLNVAAVNGDDSLGQQDAYSSHDAGVDDSDNFGDDDHIDKLIEIDRFDHSPPYMGILMLMIMGTVYIITAVLLIKYKYDVNDYRIPVVIYTVCYTLSPLLVTLVLNDAFGGKPKGYDIFQIILGCMLAAVFLMRTPHFTGRLFKGKVCPLTEGEFCYALIHFGM